MNKQQASAVKDYLKNIKDVCTAAQIPYEDVLVNAIIYMDVASLPIQDAFNQALKDFN